MNWTLFDWDDVTTHPPDFHQVYWMWGLRQGLSLFTTVGAITDHYKYGPMIASKDIALERATLPDGPSNAIYWSEIP